MKTTKRMLVTCLALGLSISPAYAEEAHHPDTDSAALADATTQEVTTTGATVTPDVTMPGNSSSAGMMSKGMPGGQGGRGMMGKGMQSGQGGMGMMGKGMQGGQGGMGMMGKGMQASQGGMGMMGQGMQASQGGMGMMGQGMHGGQGGMGMMGKGMHGGMGMMQKHQQVVSQLNLIEARLAKIEFLLERMIQQ